MDYEYVVEVRDCLRNTVLENLHFEDANSAYHAYRKFVDYYCDEDMITVTLTEPE